MPKHLLTQFGASVLAAIRRANEREWQYESTPTLLCLAFSCQERDMVAILNYLNKLSLVDEKHDSWKLLDGRYYTITELGKIALELYEAEKGSKALPPPVGG